MSSASGIDKLDNKMSMFSISMQSARIHVRTHTCEVLTHLDIGSLHRSRGRVGVWLQLKVHIHSVIAAEYWADAHCYTVTAAVVGVAVLGVVIVVAIGFCGLNGCFLFDYNMT